jgi:hypothetical protein
MLRRVMYCKYNGVVIRVVKVVTIFEGKEEGGRKEREGRLDGDWEMYVYLHVVSE